jgi:thiol-disulfide isomerase/thioredoxin
MESAPTHIGSDIPFVKFFKDDSIASMIGSDLTVIDFWHIRCPYCISPLQKFMNDSVKYDKITFVACAMNTGPGSYECTKDIIEEITHEDNNVVHVFAEDKELMKNTFSITTVPHCVVVQRNKSDDTLKLLYWGHTNTLNIETLMKTVECD